MFSRTPSVRLSIPIVPDSNNPVLFYSPKEYLIFDVIEKMSIVLVVLSWVAFFLAIFGSKLVGVEMMAVIQLFFWALISNRYLHTGFQSFLNVKFANGYNEIANSLPSNRPKINGIDQEYLFIYNFNWSCLLILLPFVLGFVLHLIGKLKKQEDKKNWGLRLMG